ncbi:MAG: bi-domain-containing oxidoreductase, partial [Rubripirellula sp.]
LAAAGCKVIGTDPDPAKCKLAIQSGATIAEPNLSASAVQSMSGGAGADAVLITASTSSNGPIELACEATRTKGRIVLVGVVGLEIPRRPMYFKEVEFVVSCSYGPGRYDPNYEERGIDYPIGHVRWTEQRNIQSVLDLMACGKLTVDHLISHRFNIDETETAYKMLADGSEPYLGVLLQYPETPQAMPRVPVAANSSTSAAEPVRGKLNLAVLGAGNFARMTMFPQLQKSGDFNLTTLCSASGMSAQSAGEKFGFADSTADEKLAISGEHTDAVMILTRHNLHAKQVCDALDAGKHVFVEKPLAVDGQQLLDVEQALERNPGQIVMVGFNRRFSKAATLTKAHFAKVTEPLTIQYRFNAGAIPADVWIQHPEEGGGRIIGEACHAIDLVTYLTGSLPVEVYAACIGGSNTPQIVDDQAFITVRHENGSVSSIGYLAGGDRAMSKERIEVLGGGRMAVIDDYRQVELASGGKIAKTKTPEGKGHLEEVKAFAGGLRDGAWPIKWAEILATSWTSIGAVQSLREGVPIPLYT